MSVATDQREQVVNAALKELAHIATLPEITVKIVELVEDPKSTAQDLHKIISNDPALCSRILKVVNSSFYGLPGQIASINRAIVLLGLNAVKNIAIAASLTKLFRGAQLTPTVSVKDLWSHSVSTAVVAKMLADRLKLGLSDESFLAGLMHDIGFMVALQFDRMKLIEVIQQTGINAEGVPSGNMLDFEQTVFGATHQDFGSGLCAKWKFPKPLAYVSGFHHRPMELGFEHRTLPSLVYIAERIACEAEKSFRGDLISLEIAPEVREHIKLSVDKLAELRKDAPAAIKDASGMLG
ncbi:MAG: HDOD domain-containing protein [Planctomycetota bacterium]|nr:HDOD domain-containing protein [Planctomycetota bacterium]